MPQNKAAWITSPGAHPFVVKEAPYPSAGPGEVVIKNAAIAIVCHCPVLGNIALKLMRIEPRGMENPIPQRGAQIRIQLPVHPRFRLRWYS